MAEVSRLLILNLDGEGEFETLINPTSLTQKITINYTNSPSTNGTKNGDPSITTNTNNGKPSNNSKTFTEMKPSELSFKIVLDATAVTPQPKESISDKMYSSVSEQIALFKQVSYNFNSESHAPNRVLIYWGDIIFENCKLTQLNINYLLFNPQGQPLRAELDVSFSVEIDNINIDNVKKAKSPDMSRIRVLNDDDKLSLMCAEFYGDSSKQLQVAKENGIINFRKLKPGTEIYFPPIKK